MTDLVGNLVLAVQVVEVVTHPVRAVSAHHTQVRRLRFRASLLSTSLPVSHVNSAMVTTHQRKGSFQVSCLHSERGNTGCAPKLGFVCFDHFGTLRVHWNSTKGNEERSALAFIWTQSILNAGIFLSSPWHTRLCDANARAYK